MRCNWASENCGDSRTCRRIHPRTRSASSSAAESRPVSGSPARGRLSAPLTKGRP